MRFAVATGCNATIALLLGASCGAGADSTPVDGGDAPPVDGGEADLVAWGETMTLQEARLGFTQTTVGGRDDRGALHVAFWQDDRAYHGVLQPGDDVWTIEELSKLNANASPANVGLGIAGDGELIAAWTERMAGNDSVLVSTRSANYGADWESPIEIARGAIAAVTTLHVYVRDDSTTGCSLAWSDASDGQVRVRSWSGATWNAGDWSEPIVLSRDLAGVNLDPTLGGQGSVLVASWENDATMPKKFLFSRSIDGGSTWSAEPYEFPVPEGASRGGQDASFAVAGNGALLVAYQNRSRVHVATSQDGGQSFATPVEIGPGLFIKVATSGDDDVALGWEYFEGADYLDNTVKSVGLTYSFDALSTQVGPHAMPGSATDLGNYFPYVMLSESAIDVFWLDTNDVEGVDLLKYRGATM